MNCRTVSLDLPVVFCKAKGFVVVLLSESTSVSCVRATTATDLERSESTDLDGSCESTGLDCGATLVVGTAQSYQLYLMQLLSSTAAQTLRWRKARG